MYSPGKEGNDFYFYIAGYSCAMGLLLRGFYGYIVGLVWTIEKLLSFLYNIKVEKSIIKLYYNKRKVNL